jgi:hypothetical protein
MYGTRLMFLRIASVVSCLILAACNGGGGGSGNTSSNSPNNNPQHTVVSLAKSGGYFSLTLANNQVYFTDYADSIIQSVPVNGGSIMTHLNYHNSSLNPLVDTNGTIFTIGTQDGGGVYGIPDYAEGITTLSAMQKNGNSTEQIAISGSYVYWVEVACDVVSPTNCYSSTIWRAPLTPTSTTPYSQRGGRTTDLVVNKVFSGISKFALDGNILFVSESQTGNIYRYDLGTGNLTQIVSGLSPGALITPSLVVTNEWLFALTIDSGGYFKITRIDKITGITTTIATSVNSTSILGNIVSDAGGVYWWQWQSPAIAINLKRIDSITGQITTLTSVPVGSPNTIAPGFYSDGTNVWWIRQPAGIPDFDEIQHVSVQGGTVTTLASLDPNVEGNPGALVGDATALYWTGPNGFWKIPKTGGTPTNIPSGIVGKYIGPSTFAVTDTHFVWGENYSLDAVRKMPKTGVPDPTLIWQATDDVTEISQPSAIASDDQNIYWVTRDYHIATVSSTISAYSRSIAGGPAQLLSTLTSIGTPVRILPYSDALLIVRDSASGGGISAIPKTGGSEVELISTDQSGLTDIFVKNDIMYVLYSGLFTYDLNTGKINTLIDSIPSTNRLYVDDSHIYWTEANRSSATGAVRRIPISGGTEETIYSGDWSWDISGDAGSIYWATGYEILSANK